MGRLIKLFLAHFRVNSRNRLALFFSLIFPLIFIGIMGIAFQEGDPSNTTISLGIVSNDKGIPSRAVVPTQNGSLLSHDDISTQFVNLLGDITYQNSTTPVFDIHTYHTIDEVGDDLNRREIKALLIIPQDFSLAYMASIRDSFDLSLQTQEWQDYPNPGYNTTVDLRGDTSLVDFTIANTVIDEVLAAYFSLGEQPIIDLEVDRATTDGFTVFDVTVPGLVIFALISNVSTVAAVALGDVESGLLDRLRLSKMRNWEYTVALILSQQTMALIQIPIMFGGAMIFGFPFTPKLGLAFVFTTFVSLAMTGLGLMLAGLVSNAQAVGGLAAIVTTPMAFLAGAFFSMPNPTIIPAGGILGSHEFGVFDLLPPRMAIDSLRLLLIDGFSLSQVLYEFGVVVFLSMLYLFLGILIYTHKHFRAD